MKRLKTAVLLSGGGSTLKNLLESREKDGLPIDIELVLSSRPDAGGLGIAAAAGIPAVVVNPRDFTMGGREAEVLYRWEDMSREVDRHLLAGGFDLVCMAGYLSRYVIPDALRGKVLNIHPSLIPMFCGAGMYGMRVHRAVVAAGVRITGCTVHIANNEYDAGPIILQRSCPVYSHDAPGDVQKRVFREECRAYPDAIRLFAGGRLRLDADSRLLVGGGEERPDAELEQARATIEAEIDALHRMRDNLDGSFPRALDVMFACKGRVVVSGMGKAGLIGKKIAATLASTGTPAFFLHPAEALHGDLGMIAPGDVCLFLSNSGESDEISRLLPHVRRLGAPVIGMTGNKRSTLAGHSDILLHLGEIAEARPLGLAPTATTAAILAMGDALAMCLMSRRGFKEADYAAVHPAGALGRRVAPVETVMRLGDAVALATPDTSVKDTLFAMTKARSGAAAVVNEAGRLKGVFCDGDLRRGLEKDPDFLVRPVGEVMVRNCVRARAGDLAGDVLSIMKQKRIADVPVVDAAGVLLGMADLKGLLASL